MAYDIPVGARVRVLDTDQIDLGLGTYEGEVAFDGDGEIPVTDETDEFEAQPKIILDSGAVKYGFECWWTVIDEELETAVAEVEKVGKTEH